MKRVRLSPAQVRAIARVWTGTPKNEARLAKFYGVKPRALRLVARRGGSRKARKVRSPFTAAQTAAVRERYAGMRTDELARALGKSYGAVSQLAARMGIGKSAAYLAGPECSRNKVANKGCFRKGQVPPNKGKKMPPGWSPGRMRETQFKRGRRSGKAAHNHMPIGAERDIEGVLYRKVADVPNVAYTVNWKAVHHLLWESVHGPIPPGHMLRFKDGNRRNLELGNFELLSFADNMRLNTIHRYPPPRQAGDPPAGAPGARDRQTRGGGACPMTAHRRTRSPTCAIASSRRWTRSRTRKIRCRSSAPRRSPTSAR